MAILTRYTAKFYKDSTKTFYAVFISAHENPILNVKETTGKYSSQLNTDLLPDGSYRHVLKFSKTTSGSDVLLFSIEFTDGATATSVGEVPSDSQILVAAHDSLTFATTFSGFEADSKSYSISDSVYYSKSPYNILYVYPRSSANHLDTSSTEDFYYATSGSAAYIASNDLQNDFLIGRNYSLAGLAPNQLGKFSAGKGEQVLSFSQYTDVDKAGPVIHGHTYINTKTIPKGGNAYTVSKNAASSNYYLNGCSKHKLPCTDDGTSFSTDCITGVTLSSSIINDPNNIFIDGACAANCEGYSLKVVHNKLATNTITADATIQVEVLLGTANYSYVLSATKIGPGLTFVTQTGTSTPAIMDFSSLYAGEYLLTITDSNGTPCVLREIIFIESEATHSTLKGCTESAAINYDAAVLAANGWSQTCVYCNDTGNLVRHKDASDGILMGPFAKTNVKVQNATSILTTGVSNDDGIVTIEGLTPLSYTTEKYKDSISGEIISLKFNTGDYFTGGTNYEYKLYSLKRPPSSEYLDATFLTNNGALVSTQTNAGGLMQFTGLEPKNYAVKIAYTNSGSVEEYEDCYIIKIFSVYLKGCTDSTSKYYNSEADIDDGSCSERDEDFGGCGSLNLGIQNAVECTTNGGIRVVITSVAYQYDAIALVAAAGITDDITGLNVNPANCYYALEITFVGGLVDTLSYSTFTFTNLAVQGHSHITSCNSLIEKINLVFTYGGEINSNAFWTADSYLEQGPCPYSKLIFPNPGAQDNCCDESDPDTGQDIPGCTDSTACNYDSAANVDDGSCEWSSCEIVGCMDPNANNYDPTATVDDGKACTYDILGCMDPDADNYDSTATIDDGSCLYPTTPCDIFNEVVFSYPDASFYSSTVDTTNVYSSTEGMCIPNSDGSLTVNLPVTELNAAGLTSVYWTVGVYKEQSTIYSNLYSGGANVLDWMSAIAGASLVIADGDYLGISDTYTFDLLSSGTYTIVFTIMTDISADNTTIIYSACATPEMQTTLSIGNCTGYPEYVYGCTDPTAINFNVGATDDDETCMYEGSLGCTDMFAMNWNSNVTIDDGSCNYQGSACAPPVAGTCIPNMYTDDSEDSVSSCCIPNDIAERLDSIEKCLANSGSRFYNKMITGLSDTCSTLDAWKMMLILEILRKRGLPCVYNCSDAATQSLGGITCSSVWEDQGSNLWVSTGTYNTGHVVKGQDGNYYVAINNIGLNYAPNTTVSNSDNPISGWTRCCDESTYSGNINYLTTFISFAEKYCKDCEIPPYVVSETGEVEVQENLTIGGINIKNNGGSFEAS